MPNRLTIGDGFQFGCGFMAAGCLFYLCVMILVFGATMLLTLLGVGIAMPQFPLVR
jgi:hypothetical protein